MILDHLIYSCDDHLDLGGVPRDLWTSRLPARMQDRCLHTEDRNGMQTWVCEGLERGPSGPRPGFVSAIERAGLPDDGFRSGNPSLRLGDMERDGIHASIVYGPAALFGFQIEDRELAGLTIRAWNDWASEVFNVHEPDRLSALAFLPADSAEDATAELLRVAAQGHRGAVLNPFEADIGSPDWDRLWAAAAEVGLPISFHIGGGTGLRPVPGTWELPALSAILPMLLCEPFSIMMYCGALERHPGLKLVLAESGVGWVPYLVARMDDIFEKHAAPWPDANIRTRPSEIFARQVYATFEEEPFGPELIPLLGAGNFMWACDYPHPDSTFPNSRQAIEHALGKLSPEEIRAVTADTCRDLYRLP